MDIIRERYREACAKAQARSHEFGCVQHVCAIVEKIDGIPQVTRFIVSDWTDGSTTDTFDCGRVLQ